MATEQHSKQELVVRTELVALLDRVVDVRYNAAHPDRNGVAYDCLRMFEQVATELIALTAERDARLLQLQKETDINFAAIEQWRKHCNALAVEVEALKDRELKALDRVAALTAERDAYAAALAHLLEAAGRCRHWHNTGRDDEGTIISSVSWRALKEAEERCADPATILAERDKGLRRKALEQAAKIAEVVEKACCTLLGQCGASAVKDAIRRELLDVKAPA